MQVMKFGGTSVANAENMKKVVDIVSAAVDRDRTILVLSAISGCTDTLIRTGHPRISSLMPSRALENCFQPKSWPRSSLP